MQLGNNLDFVKNEIQNARIQNLGSAPGSPVEGQIYWDTTDHRPYFWNNNAGAWQSKATDSDLLQGQNSAYHLSRANHSGSQLASTISNFDTQVRTNRLDQMASPTASVSFNSQRITGLADAVSATDAATLQQVQSAAAGIDAKASVRFTTTANITLSGLSTQGGGDWGSALTSGDRILVKNQTTGAENGIYTCAAGSWPRATDCNSATNYTPQAFVFVEESNTTLAGSQWKVSTSGVFVIGTTSITWAQFGTGTTYTADANGGLLLTGSAFSVKLPGSSGLVEDSTGLYVDSAIVVKKYATNIGDGSSTTIIVTHNLNTRDVTVAVRLAASTYDAILVDWAATTVNTVTLTFSTAPSSNQYRCIVHG